MNIRGIAVAIAFSICASGCEGPKGEPGAVGPPGAFEAKFAGMGEDSRAVAFHVFVEPDWPCAGLAAVARTGGPSTGPLREVFASLTCAPVLRAMMRKPSCLISCSH
jgi:hypothetical protein